MKKVEAMPRPIRKAPMRSNNWSGARLSLEVEGKGGWKGPEKER